MDRRPALAKSATLVVAAALLIAFSGWAGQADASSASYQSQMEAASSDSDLHEALRIRAERGLETNLEFVEALAASTPPSAMFGIPLAPAEEGLLRESVRIHDELGPLKQFEHEHSNVWGGTWLTYPVGRTKDHATSIHIALLRDSHVGEADLAALIPAGAELVLHEAQYTEADLNGRQLKVLNDSEFFRSIGTELYSVGTSVQDNRLSLVVSNADERIVAAILEHFPPEMVKVVQGGPVEPDTCSRTGCGPPWRAGLKIYGPTTTDQCTLGFTGRKFVFEEWVYVLWTAGHCYGGTWHLGSPSGTTIGSTITDYLRNGSSFDIQTISVSDTQLDDDFLYGSATCTTCLQLDVGAKEAMDADFVGEWVVNNGARSGSQSGSILETHAAAYGLLDPYTGHTYMVSNLRRASYTRMLGDSGGPVLTHNGAVTDRAVGSHTDHQTWGGSDTALYTHIALIEAITGYTLYTTGD
jgi:hypothetical protein